MRQQPERSRSVGRRLANGGRPGSAQRILLARRTLRAVIGHHRQGPDGRLAQAGAQALQASQRPFAARRLLEQMGAVGRPVGQFVGLQAQRLDRGPQGQATEMFAQQAQKTSFFGARFGKVQGHGAPRSIVVQKMQGAAAYALLANMQPSGQRGKQALPGKNQRFGMLDA